MLLVPHVKSVAYADTAVATDILIRLEAPHADLARRRAIHLSCILDRSGSMRGTPFETLKTAMHNLIDRMDPRDQLSIVSYSFDATIDSMMMTMNAKNKRRAHRVVDCMRATGGTNLSGGLMLGMDELAAADTNGADGAIMLLTDGKPNVGIKACDRLSVAVRERVKSQLCNYASIKMYTFGLGPDHDRKLLFTLSNESCNQWGCYYNLEDENAIDPAFAECLTSLQSVVAQDATLAVEMGNDAMLIGCHTRYPVDKAAGLSKRATIALGHLPTGKKIDILLTVQLLPDNVGHDNDLSRTALSKNANSIPNEQPHKEYAAYDDGNNMEKRDDTTLFCTMLYFHAHTRVSHTVRTSCRVARHYPSDKKVKTFLGDAVVVNADVEYWRNVKLADNAIAWAPVEDDSSSSLVSKELKLKQAIDAIEASVAAERCQEVLSDLKAHVASLRSVVNSKKGSSATAISSDGATSTQALSIRASSVRKGQLVLHHNQPFRVVEVSASKTGKHGRAKVFLKLQDMLNNNTYVEDVFLATDELLLAQDPRLQTVETTYQHGKAKQPGDVTVFEVTLLSIDEDGFVTFLDGRGEVYSHLKLPEVPSPKPPLQKTTAKFHRSPKGGPRCIPPPIKQAPVPITLRQEVLDWHERGEELLLTVLQKYDSETIVAFKVVVHDIVESTTPTTSTVSTTEILTEVDTIKPLLPTAVVEVVGPGKAAVTTTPQNLHDLGFEEWEMVDEVRIKR